MGRLRASPKESEKGGRGVYDSVGGSPGRTLISSLTHPPRATLARPSLSPSVLKTLKIPIRQIKVFRALAVFAPSVLLFGQGVEFRQSEPCADDRLMLLAGLVFDVSGGDYRAVLQYLHAGVAAVVAGVAVEKFYAILARPAFADVVIGAHPGDEVVVGRAAARRVAKGDHQAIVLCIDARVPVAGQSPGRVLRLTPRFGFVAAEHHQTAPFVGVLSHQAAQFFPVGRAEDERFARSLVLYPRDEGWLGPGQSAIGGSRLHHLQIALDLALHFVTEHAVIHAEVAAVFQLNHGAEGHDALEIDAQLGHFLPGLASVLTDNAWHSAGRENPNPLLARRIDQTIDARAVTVMLVARRHPIVQPLPSQPRVVAAAHRAGRAAVANAPNGEHGLLVGKQQGRWMALVDLFRTGGDDHVPFGLFRNIDYGKVFRLGLFRRRCDCEARCTQDSQMDQITSFHVLLYLKGLFSETTYH